MEKEKKNKKQKMREGNTKVFGQNDLKSKVFDEIKKNRIKPIPEWQFLLKRGVFWGGFVLSVVFGALSMSVVFYLLNVQDWDLYMKVHESFLKFLFFAIPYFWVIVLLIFAFVAFYNYKHTDTGYRYNYVLVFVSSIFISVGLGGLFYIVGVSEWVDDKVRDKIPIYRDLHGFQEKMWMSPEKGLLSGKILKIMPDGVLIIDVEGRDWKVNFLELDRKKMKMLNEGVVMKFIGEMSEEGVFEAVDIRPWEKRPPLRKIFSK